MQHRNKMIGSALTAVLTLGSMAVHGHDVEMEKCAGVIKANKNDCGSSIGGCHGSIHVDKHPEAWIEVPKGTCEKIVGAYVTSSPYAIPGGKEAYEAAQKKGRRG